MKTYLNLAIAFTLGLLVATTIQFSQAVTKTYDAVQLAQYSACLEYQNWGVPSPIEFVLGQCVALKPKKM